MKKITIWIFIFFPLYTWSQTFDSEFVKEWSNRYLKSKFKSISNRSVKQAEQLQSESSPSSNKGETNLTSSFESESEIFAVIHPRDTNSMIFSCIRWEEGSIFNPSGYQLRLPIYYSKDAGKSWLKSNFDVTKTLGFTEFSLGGGDPVLVYGNNGEAHFFGQQTTISISSAAKFSIDWATSKNGGKDWVKSSDSAAEEFAIGNLVTLKLVGKAVDKPWAVIDNSTSSKYQGNIYLAYTEFNYAESGEITYSIKVKTKNTSQSQFGVAQTVSQAGLSFVHFSHLSLDSNGGIHLVFSGAKPQDTTLQSFYCTSIDGGKTFSAPQLLFPVHLPCYLPGNSNGCDVIGVDSSRMYPCLQIAVDRSNAPTAGHLYAVWMADGLATQLNKGLDIYFSKSIDQGKTWSTPRVINQDNTARHQFHPNLSVTDQGVIFITWYDRRADSQNKLTQFYAASSYDGGKTFIEQPITTTPTDFGTVLSRNDDFGIGEYTSTIFTPKQAIPFWADGRGNNGNLEVYMASIGVESKKVTSVRSVNIVENQLAMSPNPTTGEIMLKLPELGNQILQVVISNGVGRKMKTFTIQPQSQNENKVKVYIEGLLPGLYTLSVFRQGKLLAVDKLVIMR